VYLGKKPAKMQTKLAPDEIYTGFDLIALNQVPYEKFLQSDVPEEFILSILADMREVEPDKIVASILFKLKETYESTIRFQKYVKQLVVLSRLRNLSKIANKTVKNMPIEYDVKQDAFYKEGVADERKRMEVDKKNLIINLIKINKLTFQEIAEITLSNCRIYG